jgi:hypothetical protein
MKITFQKQPGEPSLGVVFLWKMEIRTGVPATITDHLIPELCFDYFLIQKGKIECIDDGQGTKYNLPSQSLRTIHNHSLTLVFSTPLVLYGARLSLPFAESFWAEMNANCFLEQAWVSKSTENLDAFKRQIVNHLELHSKRKIPYPMFSGELGESMWLVNFSARHKRRLYKMIFGLSRKEMQSIRNLHLFLDQACDFSTETPRIIRHVNPDVFYDQPHLNHTFRKMTGSSPAEYFQANSILQDHLLSASYNEISIPQGRL